MPAPLKLRGAPTITTLLPKRGDPSRVTRSAGGSSFRWAHRGLRAVRQRCGTAGAAIFALRGKAPASDTRGERGKECGRSGGSRPCVCVPPRVDRRRALQPKRSARAGEVGWDTVMGPECAPGTIARCRATIASLAADFRHRRTEPVPAYRARIWTRESMAFSRSRSILLRSQRYRHNG